jgi:hypothetical protein
MYEFPINKQAGNNLYQDKKKNTTDPHFNFIKTANVGGEFDPLVDTINTAVRSRKKVFQRSYTILNPATVFFHLAGMGTAFRLFTQSPQFFFEIKIGGKKSPRKIFTEKIGAILSPQKF